MLTRSKLEALAGPKPSPGAFLAVSFLYCEDCGRHARYSRVPKLWGRQCSCGAKMLRAGGLGSWPLSFFRYWLWRFELRDYVALIKWGEEAKEPGNVAQA